MQFTIDELKVLFADRVIEAELLRREVAGLTKENEKQRQTIQMIGDKLSEKTAQAGT